MLFFHPFSPEMPILGFSVSGWTKEDLKGLNKSQERDNHFEATLAIKEAQCRELLLNFCGGCRSSLISQFWKSTQWGCAGIRECVSLAPGVLKPREVHTSLKKSLIGSHPAVHWIPSPLQDGLRRRREQAQNILTQNHQRKPMWSFDHRP